MQPHRVHGLVQNVVMQIFNSFLTVVSPGAGASLLRVSPRNHSHRKKEARTCRYGFNVQVTGCSMLNFVARFFEGQCFFGPKQVLA
jgi:hypothetical protein